MCSRSPFHWRPFVVKWSPDPKCPFTHKQGPHTLTHTRMLIKPHAAHTSVRTKRHIHKYSCLVHLFSVLIFFPCVEQMGVNGAAKLNIIERNLTD